MTGSPADFARPLELTMAVRNRRAIPPALFRSIVVEAVSAELPAVLAIRQAAFAGGLADAAEAVADAFLRSPSLLRIAAARAAAGDPATAAEIGLDAGSILRGAGIAVGSSPHPP